MSRTKHGDRDARRTERAETRHRRAFLVSGADQQEARAERAEQRRAAEQERAERRTQIRQQDGDGRLVAYLTAEFRYRNPENGDEITYRNSSPITDALRRATFRAAAGQEQER